MEKVWDAARIPKKDKKLSMVSFIRYNYSFTIPIFLR